MSAIPSQSARAGTAPAHPALAPSARPARLVLLVLLAEALALSLRAVLQRHLESAGTSPADAQLWSYLVVPPLLLALLFPLSRSEAGALRASLAPAALTLRCVLIGLLVGLSLRLAIWGWLAARVAFGWQRNPDGDAVAGPLFLFDCPPLPFIALHLLVMSVLVPFIEEVINRGAFLRWLLPHGRIVAVVASATLFALFHNPQAIVNAFVIGLFLGTLYLNTASLWCSITAHSTLNGLIILDWYCLRGTWNPDTATPALAVVGTLGVSLLLASGALAAVLVSRRVAGALAGNPPPVTAR